MDIYQKLFIKGYLKGPYKNSPLNLNGIEKLTIKFKKQYNFINITILNENDIINEFNKFYQIYYKLEKEIKLKFNVKNKIDKDYDSQKEDELFSLLKKFNKKYDKYNDQYNKILVDKEDETTIFRLREFSLKLDIILNNLMCKKILQFNITHKMNYMGW